MTIAVQLLARAVDIVAAADQSDSHSDWLLAARAYLAEPDAERRQLIETARQEYGSEDIEIDDDAQLSVADGGTWVAAGVWIPDPVCDDCRNLLADCDCEWELVADSVQ